MSRSINDNLKRKKELEDELKRLLENTKRDEARLLKEIAEQDQYIQAYLTKPEDVALGLQLVYIRDYYEKYDRQLVNLIRFAIKKINEGYLPELVKNGEVFGYWYNSGFDSGHSRVIYRNCGENYATQQARISLSDHLYDTEEVTTQETIAILAYLKDTLREMEEK